MGWSILEFQSFSIFMAKTLFTPEFLLFALALIAYSMGEGEA